jgi:predicted extracellular nuclease
MPLRTQRAPVALLLLALALTLGCSEESDPAANPSQPSNAESLAEPEETPIFVIQGRSHVSPKLGVRLVTTGVVTALANNGFYLQDPSGDGDPATADAIFVFTSSRPTAVVGQSLRVTGSISEFVPGGSATGNLSTTQLGRTSSAQPLLIEVVPAGNALPAPVVIGRGGRIPPATYVISPSEVGSPINLQNPMQAAANPFNPEVDGIDFYESLEAMRVTLQDPVAVSPTRGFSPFSSELFTLVDGGRDAEPKRDRTRRGGILLGSHPDNQGDQQPERAQVQFDATLYPGTVPAISVGDRLGDVTGVVGYNFGNFEVNATEAVQVLPAGLQPERTRLRGSRDEVTVASYNLLNLSADVSDNAQRGLLASQIVERLRSPDIIALQEIQDNNGEAGGASNTETDASLTLAALAAAIVAAGGPSYTGVDVAPAANSSGGVPGGNIRNALLYRPDRVSLAGLQSVTPAVLTAVGARDPNAFQDSRNPLAGTFTFRGKRITVLSNHFSSRSGSSPIFGAFQPFTQAAEGQREAQANAVHDYVASLLRSDRRAGVVVAGDLNTFEWTNDLTELLPGRDRILKDLVKEMEDDNRYSFIFDGNSQLLDHIFASRRLADDAEFDVVHVNTDFPVLFGGVNASDHEPLVARFELED